MVGKNLEKVKFLRSSDAKSVLVNFYTNDANEITTKIDSFKVNVDNANERYGAFLEIREYMQCTTSGVNYSYTQKLL